MFLALSGGFITYIVTALSFVPIGSTRAPITLSQHRYLHNVILFVCICLWSSSLFLFALIYLRSQWAIVSRPSWFAVSSRISLK